MWTLPLLFVACSDYIISEIPEVVVDTVPVIEVSPNEVEFGERAGGGAYRSAITVKNAGGGRLRIDALQVEGSEGFTTEWQPPFPFEIGAGYSYTFPLVFSPQFTGEASGRLVFVNNAENAEEGLVTMTGTGIVGDLVVTPASWELGAITPGCELSEIFQLSNAGNGPLTIQPPQIDGSPTWEVESAGTEPFVLAPGDFRSVRVLLDAEGSALTTADLVFVSDDPQGEVRVPMSYSPEWPLSRSDERVVPAESRVNIMFAVDGSRSMSDEQAILAQEFRSFISAFDGTDVDWRIGVVTRDDGCFTNGVLGPETSNVVGQFDQAVRAIGDGGVLTEQLLALANQALFHTGPGGCNSGFLDSGELHLVFVSDEADQSPSLWSAYLSSYQSYVAPGANVVSHAVVDYDAICGQDTTGAAGYQDIVRATGGLLLDICSSSWGSSLVDIATITLESFRSVQLTLPLVDATSIRVLYDGVEQRSGWAYDPQQNLVLIDVLPPAGTVVRVEYRGGTGCL
jgi:hypothetical protein